jgi:hypothetical protein
MTRRPIYSVFWDFEELATEGLRDSGITIIWVSWFLEGEFKGSGGMRIFGGKEFAEE